jgi:hypothetical protein
VQEGLVGARQHEVSQVVGQTFGEAAIVALQIRFVTVIRLSRWNLIIFKESCILAELECGLAGQGCFLRIS